MTERNIEQILTRRELMLRGIVGAAGVSVVGCGNVLARARKKTETAAKANSRAKSVIQIWMWGGPPHLDTFDPKPDAGYDYCGPLNKPIGTNVDGMQISELLPMLAQQADKYSIIRSMTHRNNAHETASYLVQTGRQPDRLVYPCIGSVVSLFKGYDQGYTGLIPPYVVLTELQGRFSEAGFLGPRYQPFATGGDPNQKRFLVEGIIAEGMSDDRQRSRRELLHSLDSLGKAMTANAQFEQVDKAEGNAYDLILGDSRKLFDLTEEKDDTREGYGRNTFGQACLMARRLVEKGIPYVTINYKGWDTHKQNFEIMRRKLPEMDRGMATLLQDLAQRGQLDSTIVWWGGEFGRTPKVQWEAPWNGGRGHYGNCFCSVVAGGGFKGGHVVGSSDPRGEEVRDRPVYPDELLASMYELLGIDPDGAMPNPRGIDAKVMPLAQSDGAARVGRLTEIM